MSACLSFASSDKNVLGGGEVGREPDGVGAKRFGLDMV